MNNTFQLSNFYLHIPKVNHKDKYKYIPDEIKPLCLEYIINKKYKNNSYKIFRQNN